MANIWAVQPMNGSRGLLWGGELWIKLGGFVFAIHQGYTLW